MRNICLLSLLFSFLFISVNGQESKRGEVGIALGANYYLGDLNKIPFIDSRFGAGAFYRHTFDKRFALRFSGNYINIHGKGSRTNITSLSDFTFNQTIIDVNSLLEFHFIPFIAAHKKYDFSPYVFAGVGAEYTPNSSRNFLITIPFGLGYKHNISRRFTFGIETIFYKTFTDYLDDLFASPSSDNGLRQTYYTATNDWYSFVNINLTYKIRYRVKCHAFD